MDYQVYTLPNGIRILFKHAPSTITHCCFIVNAGSRDEKPGQEGLAHFIEHLLFKETERRSTNQILNRLELVGADLNAYTTKEYTCIHASLLNQHLERAIDLFEDILFHSTFPEDEQEKERGVILDEIASYLDQPEEAIQDDFEALLFKGHPMGENILGTPESVAKLNAADVRAFMAANNNTEEMIFAVFGDYENGSKDSSDPNHFSDKFFGAVGGRISGNLYTNMGRVDFRFIGFEAAYSHEFGDYADFRKSINKQGGYYVDPRTDLFSIGLTTEVIFHNQGDNGFQHGIRGFLGGTFGHYDVDYQTTLVASNSKFFHELYPKASYFIKYKKYFGSLEIGNGVFVRVGLQF